jgi:Predicted HD superfamily hydrolase
MDTIRKEIIEALKKFFDGEYYDYIDKNLISEYEGAGVNGRSHIYDVINRAFTLNDNLKLGLDSKIISAAVFYHDIGRKIDDDTHEIISAQIFMNDKTMAKFFTNEEREIIKEAIEDHRASSKSIPRNIYGKLLSSADRNTDVITPLKRTYTYRIKRDLGSSLEDIIKESYNHLHKKFGVKGYANKVYFDDGVYQKYLNDLRIMLENYDSFRREYLKANKIDDAKHL